MNTNTKSAATAATGFGVRRLVAAFPAWWTCPPGSAARSGASWLPDAGSADGEGFNSLAEVEVFDGDKSPAQSGDESPHSKA